MRSTRVQAVFLVFFVSGMSGLIYESVWSHYVKLFLGHAAYAQTLVLTVFIGGLALGSWLCARIAERIRNPLRAYAMIEGAIGVMALLFHSIFVAATDWAFASLLPASCEQANSFCMSQWLLSALLLAPQSILLGMTFPLVSSAVLRLSPEQPGNDIATLYFVNSLGAVMGVLASAFVLIPSVGLPGTLLTAGIANLVIAAGAYFLSKGAPQALAIAPIVTAGAAPSRDSRLLRILLATALLTGLSSFIYEIVWIRMLALVLGASTHAFEIMLASFILGLALGGAWVRHRVDDSDDPVRLLAIVQLAMGIAAAATIPLYNGAFDFMAWLLFAVSPNAGGYVFFNLTSTAIALVVMLPATFCAGMTLPLITYRLLRSPAGEKSLGMVYAVNTLGAILGVAVAVHLLMSWIGLRWTLLVGCAIDVGLGVFLLLAWRGKQGLVGALRPAVIGLAVFALVAGTFDIDRQRTASGVFRTGRAQLDERDKVAFHRDGKTATVDVLDSTVGLRAIRTNGKPDAALAMDQAQPPSGDEFTMAMLAVLPLGHKPDARTAAVIGFGSGMSTSMLLASPTLTRVDTVEIEPAMVEGARLFRPLVDAAYTDPRSRIVIDDAKSYFARGRNRYDIVVSEPSNPWVSGVATLFSAEFYRRLSGYLNEGGVLSQWLHTYEIDAGTLASILEALSQTFPEYTIYNTIDADIVVIARKGGAAGKFDPQVLQYPALRKQLERLGLGDADAFGRRVVARSTTLHPMFHSFGIGANSDYFPIVEQRAAGTRFRRERVDDLTRLQTSAIPMLEMLDGSSAPAATHLRSLPVTALDASVQDAWKLHDMVLRNGDPIDRMSMDRASDAAALLMRYWIEDCRSGITFEQAFPSVLTVASQVTAYLDRQTATQFWNKVNASPCLKGLAPDQRAWLDLYAAIAARDPAAMTGVGMPILERNVGKRTGAVEFAYLAALTGFICQGNPSAADKLLRRGYTDWLKQGARPTEYRYLSNLNDVKRLPATASCSFAGLAAGR